MSERSMSFSIPEVLKVGEEGLNESLFEQCHGGPQPDTSSGKGACPVKQYGEVSMCDRRRCLASGGLNPEGLGLSFALVY